MQFNSNSWFFRTYLRNYMLPCTVCELLTTTFRATARYAAVIWFITLLVLSPIMVGLIIFEVPMAVGFPPILKTVFTGIGFLEALFGIAFVVGYLFLKIEAYIVEKTCDSWTDWGYVPKARTPGKVYNFFLTLKNLTKAVYARVKDKTCVMIEYKD